MEDILDNFFLNLKELNQLNPLCDKNYCKAKIDSWLGQLRHTNKIKTLKEITQFIKESNQYQLQTQDRLYLLNKIYEPVFSLVGSIKPSFINTPLPLSQEHTETLNLCLSLYDEIIYAHTIILHEHNNSVKRFRIFAFHHNTTLACTVQRLMRYLSQIILTKFEVYHPIEKEYWEKLYTLFLFAQKGNLLKFRSKDPLIRSSANIPNTFLQIVLLALSNPYQFNQLQIYYIYKCLAKWSRLVELKLSCDLKDKDLLICIQN